MIKLKLPHPIGGQGGCMKRINGKKLRDMINKNKDDYTFVDVRSKLEFMISKTDGFINIPANKIPRKLDMLDMSKPVVVICQSGARSANVGQYLEAQGYKVLDVTGGIQMLGR